MTEKLENTVAERGGVRAEVGAFLRILRFFNQSLRKACLGEPPDITAVLGGVVI